jgi:hypothetical protein
MCQQGGPRPPVRSDVGAGVELMLGVWLILSPLIFRGTPGLEAYVVNDVIAGSLAVAFALLCFWRPTRRAHLATDDFGLMAYDPAFMNTANVPQRDHLHRRRQGHPPLPRLPDRAARRALAASSRSPTCCSTASCRPGPSTTPGCTRSPTTRSSTRTSRSSSTASTTTPTRWGSWSAPWARCRPSTRGQEHRRPEARQADRAADRQVADARGLRLPPPHRDAVRLPRQRPVVRGQLPQHDVEDHRAEVRAGPGARAGARRAVHPARRPRAELLDDAMRAIGSSHADPYSALAGRPRRSTAASTAAPTRQVLRMLDEIGSSKKVPESSSSRQGRRVPPHGLRPPGLQELRPARQDDEAARVSGLRGDGQEPAARHRLELERIALEDDYFVERKLYPNVDFYSGIIYQAMGFPGGCSRCCSPSRARPAGWRSGRRCCWIRSRRSQHLFGLAWWFLTELVHWPQTLGSILSPLLPELLSRAGPRR